MQRLHVEDLVGELKDNPDYTFIKCKGLLNDKASAWSQTISTEKLLNIKKVRPDYFYAQYQQEPIIAGGNVIKKDYYSYYNEYPAKIKRLFVTADTAMKVKQHNDYSVFSVWGVTDTGLLWLDMVRGKWEAPDLIKQAQQVYDKWATFFEGCILSGFYIEDKASGTGLIQTLKRNTRIPVIAVPRAKDKVERLEGVLDYIASGNVCLPKFKTSMCDDIISESVAFKKDDSHTHDDIVDTLIDAVNIAEGRQQTTIPLSMYV
jgi:predicted phage terminase large subunit-like protein